MKTYTINKPKRSISKSTQKQVRKVRQLNKDWRRTRMDFPTFDKPEAKDDN